MRTGHITTTVFLIASILLACDRPEPDVRDRVAPMPELGLADPGHTAPSDPQPSTCRDEYFCARTCMEFTYFAGEADYDPKPCADLCRADNDDEAWLFWYWVSVTESSCELGGRPGLDNGDVDPDSDEGRACMNDAWHGGDPWSESILQTCFTGTAGW